MNNNPLYAEDKTWLMTHNLQEIYPYTFHHNYHTGTWTAIPKGFEKDYWNNMTAPGMLRSTDITILIDIIQRLAHDPNYLDKIEPA